MRIGTTFKISLRALRRNKMRSILTALGIIIGVGAVIAMVSIGNGAKSQVEAADRQPRRKRDPGVRGQFLARRRPQRAGAARARSMVSDAEAIKREMPSVDRREPGGAPGAQVVAGDQNWFTGNLQGESEDYLDIRQWPLASGAMFSDQDVRGANKVAIIGKTIADKLYPDGDPVGQILRIKNVPFIVTACLPRKG